MSSVVKTWVICLYECVCLLMTKPLSHPAITSPNGRAPVLYDPAEEIKGVGPGLSQSECLHAWTGVPC